MSARRLFRFKTLGDLTAAVEAMGLSIPISQKTAVLWEPLDIGGKRVPNRIVAHPMEGADGTADGKPGEWTYRRYRRVAAGGFGLQWFEATAVVQEGKGNPRQLLLVKDNVNALRDLLNGYLLEAQNRFGSGYKPYTVLQLTHAGRFSRPGGDFKPVMAVRNRHIDTKPSNDPRVISDAELDALEDRFAEASALAQEIGFDAVDIKSCHGYLISELLSAHTREGRYGGGFENRTRFLLNVVDKVRAKAGGELAVAVRLNAYDAMPYPHGWGVNREDQHQYDLSEPTHLVHLLREKGVDLINITAGVPRYIPHVTRPYDTGPYEPPEHPLQGIERILKISREVQKAAPDVAVVASGLSWLREFGPHCAAGGIYGAWFKLGGFGRQTLAYPEFPREMVEKGKMARKKCCIACGKCSELMTLGAMTGCVVRDAKVYLPIYKQLGEG